MKNRQLCQSEAEARLSVELAIAVPAITISLKKQPLDCQAASTRRAPSCHSKACYVRLVLDPNENSSWLHSFVDRAVHAYKRIQRIHWDSYGKLGEGNTWLRSLAVAGAFLLIAYLILP